MLWAICFIDINFVKIERTKRNVMKFIDLCAGIGGFRSAFDAVGNECVLSCEIDKFAQKTYQTNFKENDFATDIKKIDEKNMKNFDILCAGFPCQAFSLAGKQLGFADTRGTIFFDIQRILNEKRPEFFLLENVKNLKSHDKGNTFKVICAALDKIDYWHETFLINAQYFVPQKRERIYIIGLDKKKHSQQDFQRLKEIIHTRYANQQKQPLPQFADILEQGNEQFTLSDKLWTFLQSHANKHSAKGNGFGYGLMKKEDITARTLTARYYKDGSEILVQQEGKNPRRLSPRECARLMGYPETFKIPVSNTQAYKQFGNSVVVPIVTMFAQSIKEFKQ